MSARISVEFEIASGFAVEHNATSFEVRHLRNIEVAENGATYPTDTGGYTVVSDESGNLYVSKCHPKADRFSRSRGLEECVRKYVFRQLGDTKGSWDLARLESTGINKFKAVVYQLATII